MILPIENQVTNFEISKKLCELGVRQDSIYVWRKYRLPSYYKGGVFEDEWKLMPTSYLSLKLTEYAAYTVAELLELLPVYINNQGHTFSLKLIRGKPNSCYYCSKHHYLTPGFNAENIADVLGMAKIWLNENGYIEIKVNNL